VDGKILFPERDDLVSQPFLLAGGEAVILTRGGQPVVSVRELSGADWESASLAHNHWSLHEIVDVSNHERDVGCVKKSVQCRSLNLHV